MRFKAVFLFVVLVLLLPASHSLAGPKYLDPREAYRTYEPEMTEQNYLLAHTYQTNPLYQHALETNKTAARYTVQAGDTLYRISKFFDTSLDLLMAENRITDPTKLQVGQELIIPPSGKEIDDWIEEGSRVNQVFYATLTAYTAGYESTGKTPGHPEYGITASGAKVKENYTIAVDPKVIPLGTLVYIDGIGIRKAEDVGSAIKGNKIDVYIPDLEEALEFGVKKNVKVYVLDSKGKASGTAKPI